MYANLPERVKQQVYYHLSIIKDFRTAKQLYDTWTERSVMDSTLANEVTHLES